MYTTQNNNNSQARFQPGYYTMKAKTKVRQGLDGQTNRGILITDGNNEQWVSIPASNEVCQLNFGSKVYYHGHNARPSLTFKQEQANNTNFDNGGVDLPPQTNDPQVLANYYARKAAEAQTNSQSIYEQIEQGLYPPQNEIDYSNHINTHTQQNSHSRPSPSNTSDIDERLVEKLGVLYSNCMNLASSLNPQLDEDNQTKIAISMAIAYNPIKADSPF